MEKIIRKRYALPAIAIPKAILRGVDMVTLLLKRIISGVRTMTKKGFNACQISGAMASVLTKSRANTDSD